MRPIDDENVIVYAFRPYSNEESHSDIDIERIINTHPIIEKYQTPNPCQSCPIHPRNGGNGACRCVLGSLTMD